MKRGVFITFEGNDGAGKTSVCLAVKKQLEQEGYDVIYTREPGGSAIAEAIRDVVLDPANTKMDSRAEALLYAASRAQHLQEIVVPALNDKKIVLCDRFIDSSLVYQGYARGLGMKAIWDINQFAIEDYMPQKTMFLSVSVQTGAKRMDERGEKNRLDLEKSEFHQKVRQGYEQLLEMYPERMMRIDAEPAFEEVVQATYKEVKKVISHYE